MAPETYVEIALAVPPDVEEAVVSAVRYGMKVLGIRRTLEVKFFVQGSADDASRWHARTFADPIGGLHGAVWTTAPDRIWVRADVTPAEARRIALHEVIHVVEVELADVGLADKWEQLADAFSYAHLERSLR